MNFDKKPDKKRIFKKLDRPYDITKIRNISIIAHIDHGKSTLADRFLEYCSVKDSHKEIQQQALDQLSIERERGITVKAQSVYLLYEAKDGQIYEFNLIDTPGHTDFTYEVSRSLAACEGSLLVVDVSQGVEAQTIANYNQARNNNHYILPVLNKIDLPTANCDAVLENIHDIFGISVDHACLVSAKNNIGIIELFESVVNLMPAPMGDEKAALKALLIDSWYDTYAGVVVLVRIFDGELRAGQKILLMQSQQAYDIQTVGRMLPEKTPCDALYAGQVGYVVLNVRTPTKCPVGDTITDFNAPTAAPFPGFKPSIPVVFCSFFPLDNGDFNLLKESLIKLQLNDASFTFQPESSVAFGHGFCCGFLGILHMEIIQRRLLDEFSMEVVPTSPNVAYEVTKIDGTVVIVTNPTDMPAKPQVSFISEPWIRGTIYCRYEDFGRVTDLCVSRRGIYADTIHSGDNKLFLVYDLPLNEVIFNFFDTLKSVTQGYSSFEYELTGYQRGNLVKVEILIDGESSDVLSFIVDRDKAAAKGRALCAKLKDQIPRSLFKIAIQAKANGEIIARETLDAFRKDVTKKCHGGGDIDRKNKLLQKQKDGKERRKKYCCGNVELTQDILRALLEA